MINKEIIDMANSVSALEIPNYFEIDITKDKKILCPFHQEENPSCSFFPKKNLFHCFSCGKNLSTVGLFMELSKANGKPVSFPEAVNDILKIWELKDTAHTINTQQKKKETTGNEELYDRVLQNCKTIQGYELNYLANRGIFLNDAYVFEKNAYLKSSVDYHLRNAKYPFERKEWQTIKDEGVYYQGISSSLKANNIEILHNYYNSKNHIVYKIEYDEFIYDENAQSVLANFDQFGNRKMLIQKSIDDKTHIKRNIGRTNFCLLVNGAYNNENLYVCEGLEDAISIIQLEGGMAISLNSTSNLQSLINAMKDTEPDSYLKWNSSFDHDKAGQDATNELISFFRSENQKFIDKYPNLAKKVAKANGSKVQTVYPYYNYEVYDFPMECKDINEYWKSIVFGK